MGSPEGGGTEKYLSKRRKSASSHYPKARDWDDEEAYDEDRRYRSSKTKVSSRSDREREITREKEKDREKERDHDRGDREGRSRDEYFEKGVKQLRSFREDKHDERAERDDREVVESRAGSNKRRNASEKVSKNNEVGPTQEEKKGGRADYAIAVNEVTLRKHERAHDLGEEELKIGEPRVEKSREKERGRREEPRIDRGHNGEDEKYRRSDSRTTRGEGLGEDSVIKRNLHRERYYGKEEKKLWKKESKAERSHDRSESNVRNFITRAERFSETEDEKVRHSDSYVEESQNGETEDYQRVERTHEFRDSLKSRKGVYRAGRSHDIDDDSMYEIDLRHERATKTVTTSVLNSNYSKSGKNVEEKKSARAGRRMHSQYDEKDLRIVEAQGEGRDRYVEISGIEKHPHISSRSEKSREYVGRDKGTGDKDRPLAVLEGVEGSAEFLDSIQLHKWDRKRNSSGKIHWEKVEKEGSRKDGSSGIEQIEEESSVARYKLQEESRGLSGAYENVLDSKDEKESSRHGRQKEKVLSGSDKPESGLAEDLEVVIEESPREGNGLERTDCKWDEPEEDTLSSRMLEGEPENMLPEIDNVDVFESEEVEEECKSAFIEKVEESEQIVEYEESQDFEKVAASEEVDLGEGERGDDSQLEKPERPRREKERLEREELDEWEKGAIYKVRGERDWTKENRQFDQHLQGREKSEWQGVEVVNRLEGEMEEGGDEVPRSGRRRGRDTLEREDFDFESRFLGRDDGDWDREREREREREKEREKERQRERDRERERERDRERDRGRERERRIECYSDDYQRKGSERYDERYYEYDIEGRSSGRGREYRADHEREKFRSREAGWEELDDRRRRLNSRDRREDERAGKLASKESTHGLVRGATVGREKGDEERNWRLRSEEEKGKKPVSRDFIEETRSIGGKGEDPLDKVKAIGKDTGPDMSDEGGRSKGKHGRVITSPRSLDDRREPYKGGKPVMISRSPDDRKGHRSGKTVVNSRSPDDRRAGYRSGKAVTSSRSPDDRRGHRSSKAVTGSRSPEDRRGGRSDWEDVEKDWSDERAEYDREKSSKRRVNQKRDNDSSERERDRYRSRERPHERNWERGKGKDKVDNVDRSYDRHQNHWKGSRDSDFQVEQDNWESKMRHENADREKLERRMLERESSERNRMDRERVEGLRSPQGFASISESTGRGHQMSSNFLEPGRGFSSHGGPFMPPGGDPGFFQGDYFGGMGEVDWDGSMMDDRMRQREGIFLGSSDRFMENEGPLGHDAGYGPGRGAAGDGGMNYSHLSGRGRASKASPNNRGRGGMMGHEGRPLFNNIQPSSMLRGMQQQQQQQQQQGGKGRGPRGGPKGARGPGREVQRPNVNPLMGPGPGIGPHFGPMGPQGLMSGMGMGPGPGPGLTPGPNMGQFPLLPFGGPMGWGVGPGGGEMGMMGCPPGPGPVMGPGPGGLGPRFGPGMVPGPVPNMFFNPPGPGRGGHGGMPSGLFGGAVPPFNGQSGGGGRGQMGEKGTSGVGRGLVGRANGPPGRGPSRGEQNDYSQHFVDTGLRPQNFIRDVELADRFEEYPKLKELITRKDQLIAKRATPPMYMQCDLRTTELSPDVFGTKFDVILVDPPWEEYVRRAPGIGDSMEWWSAEEIQNLRIEAIADTPAFIFLWVGDAEGLEQGRLCLKKWGFRRCEDICWVKTNRENPTPALRHDSNTLFQHSKEHCLMGIRGTVRRSTDGHIIHANVDTDIIISEEPEYGSTKKPEELYHIIEHFAQGMRRIELFGEDHNIRAGWVTVGKGLTSSNFNPQIYAKNFVDTERKVWQGGRGNPSIDASHLVGTTPEIEALRPKSPPPRPQAQPSGQGNVGNSLSQPSAGNSISKKASTAQPGGVQNGHPAALIPGAGHGSANPSVAGSVVIGQPPHVGGRGGGHGQIPKMRPVLPGPLIKPLGACPGIVEMAGFDEEASYGGDMQEATSAEDLH